MYDPAVTLPEPKVINPLADLKEVRDVGAENSWVGRTDDKDHHRPGSEPEEISADQGGLS
jgi:hypothetical protein